MAATRSLLFICSLSAATSFDWNGMTSSNTEPTIASSFDWGTSAKSSGTPQEETDLWGNASDNAWFDNLTPITTPTASSGPDYLTPSEFSSCISVISNAGKCPELNEIVTLASEGIVQIPNCAAAMSLSEKHITILFTTVPMPFAIAMATECISAIATGSAVKLLAELNKQAAKDSSGSLRGSGGSGVWGSSSSDGSSSVWNSFSWGDSEYESDPIDTDPTHEYTYEEYQASGAKALDDLQDHLDGSSTAMQEVGGKGILKSLKKGLKWVRKGWSSLKNAVKDVATKVWAAVKKAAPGIANFIGKAYQSISKVVVEGVKKIGKGITQVAHAIGDAIEFLASCFDLPALFSCLPGRYGTAGAKIECSLEDHALEFSGQYSPKFGGASASGDMSFSASLELTPGPIIVAVDLAGPKLVVTIPSLTLDLQMKAEYAGSTKKYQDRSDNDKSSFTKEVQIFSTKPKTIKKGTAMAGPVPIVYQVYVKVELWLFASVEAAMETSIEFSLPEVLLLKAMEFGFDTKNGKMVPVYDNPLEIPKDLKEEIKKKLVNAIKTNAGATLTAALAIGMRLELIIGCRANGVPIEIPIPFYLQAEVSAAGTVQGDLTSGVLFSTSGEVKVEVTASLQGLDIGTKVPGRDETIEMLCQAIADLAPKCIQDIIQEFCMIPLKEAIPDFQATEFSLVKIPGNEFGVLWSATKKFGKEEGGVVPGDAQQCQIRRVKTRSNSPCNMAKSYWCQGDYMYVARGCRGKFACNENVPNAGGHYIEAKSINYEQARYKCVSLPKKIKPCRLRTAGTTVRPSTQWETYFPGYLNNVCEQKIGGKCWSHNSDGYAGDALKTGWPKSDRRFSLMDAKDACGSRSDCGSVICDGGQMHAADSSNDEATDDTDTAFLPQTVPANWGSREGNPNSANNGAAVGGNSAGGGGGGGVSGASATANGIGPIDYANFETWKASIGKGGGRRLGGDSDSDSDSDTNVTLTAAAGLAKHNFPPMEVLFPSLFPKEEVEAARSRSPPGPDGTPWSWQQHLRAFVEKNKEGWGNLQTLVTSLQPAKTSTSGGECSANTKSMKDLRGSGYQCQDHAALERARALKAARLENIRRR